MSLTKPGERVVAVESATTAEIRIYGFGVYVGDEVPDSAGGMMGEMLREGGVPNPKILLDNGDVVWGCECWWGSEATFKGGIGTRTVVEVDIQASRERAAEAPAEDDEG